MRVRMRTRQGFEHGHRALQNGADARPLGESHDLLRGHMPALDVVGRTHHELVLAGHVLPDQAELRFEPVDHLAGDRVERVLENEAGGDGPAGIQQGRHARGLLLLTPLHLAAVDGHRRQIAEALGALHVFLREATVFARLKQYEVTVRLRPEAERDTQARLLAPLLQRGARVGIDGRIGEPLLQGFALLEESALYRLIGEQEDAAEPVPAARLDLVARPRDEDVQRRVVLVDETLRHVDRLGHAAGDELERGLRVFGAGEGAAHLHKGFRHVAVAVAGKSRSHGSARCGAAIREQSLERAALELSLSARRAPRRHEAGVGPPPQRVLADVEEVSRRGHAQPASAGRGARLSFMIHRLCIDRMASFLDHLSVPGMSMPITKAGPVR